MAVDSVHYDFLCNNIGIKHVFLCIKICWTPRVVLKPKPKRRGFKRPPRGPADISVSENHVRSLLLHEVILSLENFGKTLRKVHFCITILACKSMMDS